MPEDHELQLMLVNTLRKVCHLIPHPRSSIYRVTQDLESPELPRICLALDTLIQFSTADVIPAIQARLTALLSFTSSVGSLRTRSQQHLDHSAHIRVPAREDRTYADALCWHSISSQGMIPEYWAASLRRRRSE